MSNMSNNGQRGTAIAQTTDKSMMVVDAELNAANIFTRKSAFDLAARMADAFSKSTIVPPDYQGNAANCLIALEMANRLGTGVMMVMQNLYIVNKRPAWSSQFIIAMINNSKKYRTELQYDIKGEGMGMECTAFAIDSNGRKVIGPKITMEMAKNEGWLDKNGSKWKTMPEVMIRYRAASFFGRLHCPDLIMGIYSADEVIDIPESSYRYVEPIPSEPVVTAADDSFEDIPAGNENTEEPSADGMDSGDVDFNAPPSTSEDTTEDSSTNEVLACLDCGVVILQAEKTFSVKKYGRELCRSCQKEASKVKE